MKKSNPIPDRTAPIPKCVLVSHDLNRNTEIIPASQLKAITEWPRRANHRPDESTLLVLPAGNDRMEVAGQRIRVAFNFRSRIGSVGTVHRAHGPRRFTVRTWFKLKTEWPIWSRPSPGRRSDTSSLMMI